MTLEFAEYPIFYTHTHNTHLCFKMMIKTFGNELKDAPHTSATFHSVECTMHPARVEKA